ncbi:MAG: hypothetical protein ACREDO_13900 [Methyloceanibacter sp.]
MSIRSLALASLIIVAAAFPGAAETKKGEPAEPPQEWTEFHYAERGFVISFPGTTTQPKAVSTPVSGQNPLLQHEYQVNVEDDTVYSVVVFEYPEGKAPRPPGVDYYGKVVNAYAKGSATNVRKKGAKTIDRRPGYEAKAEDGRGKLNHLIEVVGNGDRVYMLVTAGPKGHADSDAAERFSESFRLLGGPPPVKSSENSPGG